MPSLLKRSRWLCCSLLCALVSISSASLIYAQQTNEHVTETEVKQALKTLKEDPNLVDKEKTKSLHWVHKNAEEQKKQDIPSWLRWLRDLFAWLSHTSRLLLWIVIGSMVAIAVIFIYRILRNYQRPPQIPLANLPTHVRDLDIRPESLPDDIGAAVWQLWQQNEHRSSLALLYRGLLSRLVHIYAVPIKDSSTESQCLELARAHLQTTQTDYVSQALKVWQFAVYGAQLPDTEIVQQLCEQFAGTLGNQKRLDAAS